jgi:hypothetical protein
MLEDMLDLAPPERLIDHYGDRSRSDDAEESRGCLGSSPQHDGYPVPGLYPRLHQCLGDRLRSGSKVSIADGLLPADDGHLIACGRCRIQEHVSHTPAGRHSYRLGAQEPPPTLVITRQRPDPASLRYRDQVPSRGAEDTAATVGRRANGILGADDPVQQAEPATPFSCSGSEYFYVA